MPQNGLFMLIVVVSDSELFDDGFIVWLAGKAEDSWIKKRNMWYAVNLQRSECSFANREYVTIAFMIFSGI